MKKRLDVLIYEKGFAESREKAKTIIMAGQVYVNNQKADKCGASYDENDNIEVRGGKLKYVSRGGLKLEKGINNFGIRIDGLTAMDIGASTGGFTDWSEKGLRYRRRLRPACVEAEDRRQGCKSGKNKYAKRNEGACSRFNRFLLN